MIIKYVNREEVVRLNYFGNRNSNTSIHSLHLADFLEQFCPFCCAFTSNSELSTYTEQSGDRVHRNRPPFLVPLLTSTYTCYSAIGTVHKQRGTHSTNGWRYCRTHIRELYETKNEKKKKKKLKCSDVIVWRTKTLFCLRRCANVPMWWWIHYPQSYESNVWISH